MRNNYNIFPQRFQLILNLGNKMTSILKNKKTIEVQKLKDGTPVIIYSKDQLVTFVLNFEEIAKAQQFPQDLIAYWGFLTATYKGSFYNCGEDSQTLDIGQFNNKYPNAKWDHKTKTLSV